MSRHPLLPQLDVARVLGVRRASGLVALFDLDGVLAPIAPTPDAALVPHATRLALRRLARRDDTTVGIVSGRPLVQVERLAGGPRIWLAGLHGAIRRAPGEAVWRSWSDEIRREGARLARALAVSLDDVPGVVIEPKGPVVAVHVRAAAPPGRARARNVVVALRPGGWSVLEGRRVLELRPDGLPTKGDAVRWIAETRPGAPILFVGDDVTDEDAFRALGRRDFPVLVDATGARGERTVSEPGTHARFALSGSNAVGELLTRLADA